MTLKSLLQHHSSKASILQHSAFFIVQLSHPYMTTGKTITLTIWTFVDKVMSLLLNMLSRFVQGAINCLLILSFTKDNKKEAQLCQPNNRICYSLHNFLLKIHWLSIIWFHYMLRFVNRAVGTSLCLKKLKTGIKSCKLRKF